MPFTGDLEHLSIIDVVQLLHSTRKSGTLTVRGGKGECQLVFDEGFIVSANHFDNSLRIGRILVEAGALTGEALSAALREQAGAGAARRPLVAALIESGRVARDDAYRGLETLLELTIVEVLTWKSGSFTLDVGSVAPADEYRYFPEKLHQGTRFHAENILMEALRIYDEKKRDGTLPDAERADGSAPEPGVAVGGVLSADDLGLADVDHLERRIPAVFMALDGRGTGGHRGALGRIAPDLTDAARERLATLLDALPPLPQGREGTPLSVVLYSGDELLAYCLGASCRHAGLSFFATSEEADIGPVLAQCRSKGCCPALVLDAPSAEDPRFLAAALAGLRQRARLRDPHLCAIQLVATGGAAVPDASREGVVATLAPRRPTEGAATFAEELGSFVAAFPARLEEHARERRDWCVMRVREGLDSLRGLREAPAVPRALLLAAADRCERALTLLVRGSELVPERGVGFSAGAPRAPQPLPGAPLRLPLPGSGLVAEVLQSGRCRWVPTGDPSLEPLLARVGAPRHPAALLLPLRAAGRTVSLTYADFGAREESALDLDLLEIFAAQASLALEALLFRARAEKALLRPPAPPARHQAEASPWT